MALTRIRFCSGTLRVCPTDSELISFIGTIRSVAAATTSETPTSIHPDSVYDACAGVNAALLVVQRNGVKSALSNRLGWASVLWHNLAGDEDFLQGLVKCAASGLGQPRLQEASFILVCNLCLAARENLRRQASTRCAITTDCLNRLSNHLALPLLQVICQVRLSRLILWCASGLSNLLTAWLSRSRGDHVIDDYGEEYPGLTSSWVFRLLYLPHVVRALHNLLPASVTDRIGSPLASGRLGQLITEGDIDLPAIGALFKLLACLGAGLAGAQETARLVDRLLTALPPLSESQQWGQLHRIVSPGLANLLSGIADYWPCRGSCPATGDQPMLISVSRHDNGGISRCNQLWSEVDEEVMTALLDICRAAFVLSFTGRLSRLFEGNPDLVAACLKLARCLAQCRTTTRPGTTTACVLCLLRMIGQSVRRRSLVDWPAGQSELRCLAIWLSYRMDWSVCGPEVCLTLADAMATALPETDDSSLFFARCLVPLLTSETGFPVVLRFLTACLSNESKGDWISVYTRVEQTLRCQFTALQPWGSPLPQPLRRQVDSLLAHLWAIVLQGDEAQWLAESIANHCPLLGHLLDVVRQGDLADSWQSLTQLAVGRLFSVTAIG